MLRAVRSKYCSSRLSCRYSFVVIPLILMSFFFFSLFLFRHSSTLFISSHSSVIILLSLLLCCYFFVRLSCRYASLVIIFLLFVSCYSLPVIRFLLFFFLFFCRYSSSGPASDGNPILLLDFSGCIKPTEPGLTSYPEGVYMSGNRGNKACD
jgi:hypothetical protein